MYQCRLEAPAAHRPRTPAVWRHARVRACSHCDRSVSPRHRRSPRGGCLLAAQRYSDDAARMHLESIHAAGARRSQATGSSFGMNSRASQRADELAGADPANRAPLAHPRQLAGRSWPRIRRRGARFGDGLETGHLNGRPGGREATRCAVRPLRGAEGTTHLATLSRPPCVSPPRFGHLQFFILPRAPQSGRDTQVERRARRQPTKAPIQPKLLLAMLHYTASGAPDRPLIKRRCSQAYEARATW